MTSKKCLVLAEKSTTFIIFHLGVFTGPTCFSAIVLMIVVAIVLTRSLGDNAFFLYFAEGRNQYFAIDPDHEGDMDRVSYISLFCKSFPYLISGYLNYAVALAVFPGVTSLGKDNYFNEAHQKYHVCSYFNASKT